MARCSMSHCSALLARYCRSTTHVRLKTLLKTLLAIALGGEYKLVDHIHGYAHHRAAGNGPAHFDAPFGIFVLFTQHILIAQKGKYENGLKIKKIGNNSNLILSLSWRFKLTNRNTGLI